MTEHERTLRKMDFEQDNYKVGRDLSASNTFTEETPFGKVSAFYDMTELGGFSIFAQWLAVPQADKSVPLQVTVSPFTPLNGNNGVHAERRLMIAAIPHGRRLPSGKNMTDIIGAVNEAEREKAEELGLISEANPTEYDKVWFGKDNVMLPNFAKGTLLTPEELKAILMEPGHGLFKDKELLTALETRQMASAPPERRAKPLFTAD